ncbi:MAG: GNAT family N-acetyltransferase [Gemmatimonadota bacterium]
MELLSHSDASAFLRRARRWLERAEDEHNLILGLAAALAGGDGHDGADAPWFATVEEDDRVVGCAFRTPPHKVGVTRMPLDAASLVAEEVARRFEEIPGFMGPPSLAEAAAEAWVRRRGGAAVHGMEMRIHRLDRVEHAGDAPGRMRQATGEDLPLAADWADGFARDTGASFRSEEATRRAWVAAGQLWLWEDDEPACMAVARGRTRHGVRIGYVYTPPERRRRGYASRLVAALSQRMLDDGLRFCVLYTDLANPTSNAIYRRIGYRPVCDVTDVMVEPDPRPRAG